MRAQRTRRLVDEREPPHAGDAVGEQVGDAEAGRQPVGLSRRRDEEVEGLRALIGLDHELRQPELDRRAVHAAVGGVDLAAERIEVADVAEASDRLAHEVREAKRVRVVPEPVQSRRLAVGQAQCVQEVDGLDVAARPGHAADDDVAPADGLQRAVGGVEQRRVRSRGDAAVRLLRLEAHGHVRLAPDHPAAHVGVALGGGGGEAREVRRVVGCPDPGLAAIRPARGAVDEQGELDGVTAALDAHGRELGGPVVGRVRRVRGIRGPRRRDRVPAELRLVDVDAELLVHRERRRAGRQLGRSPDRLLGGARSGRARAGHGDAGHHDRERARGADPPYPG